MADRKQTPDVLSEVLGTGQTDRRQPSAAPSTIELMEEPETQAPPSPQPPSQTRAKKTQAASGRKPSTRRTRSRRKAEPPRWEYLEILFRDYGGLRPRFVNGEEQDSWKKLPVIQEYLNQLGEEGWELAGVGSRHKDQVPFYLKRRKG